MLRRILVSLLAIAALAIGGARADFIDDFQPDFADGITASTWLTSGSEFDNVNVSYTTPLTDAFSTSSGDATVTVHHSGHGKSAGQKVIFYNTSGPVGGLAMDGLWEIATTPNGNTYTFEHTGPASSTAGPAATTRAYYSHVSDDGKLRFLCEPSHVAADDPLVFPHQRGMSHFHMFFGNTATDSNSTYKSLRTTGSGSCEGGPLNRSAYWFPALTRIDTRKVVWPFHLQLYYQVSRGNLKEFSSPACTCGGDGEGHVGCDAGNPAIACPVMPLQDFPRGFAHITGFKLAAGQRVTGFFEGWFCNVNGTPSSGKEVIYDPDTPSNGHETCGAQGDEVSLTARLGTAACWDGTDGVTQTNVMGNLDHYSHMADALQDGYGNAVCPATHPRLLPTLSFIVEFPIDTSSAAGIEDLKRLKLSSDYHNAASYPGGKTWHVDFFPAWKRQVQIHFHQHHHGMFPAIRALYIYDAEGFNAVGGRFLINANSGGMGDDCSDLGVSGNCAMKSGDLGNGFTISPIFEQTTRTDIPGLPKVRLKHTKH